jgi:DNA polymerase III epsilon subunit-like protein
MRYLSIDIETSGLNSELNCVLSIGAIIEDTENLLPFDKIPKFNAIVLQNEITGSPRAIAMNREIISLIGDYLEGSPETRKLLDEKSEYKFLEKDEVAKEFYWFLDENGFGHGIINNSGGYVEFKDSKLRPTMNNATKPIKITVAGKNFATFDKLFLERLPWWQKLIRIRQRVLDPGILFMDWKNDETVPSLNQCKERAGIEGVVTHNALEDAWDVIELLRKRY